ncbi:hypothetical protein D9757_009011 [Collybiopsis confluens]|uniref:Pirin N-terminal domain-containing protein n=1 Tax=Collybiopsis confluens TaxID=2823264 RepID=A0A8H5H2V1_9AGAR|nr:hypothetical protein D9757_009011 [Collybiopsis confluens]
MGSVMLAKRTISLLIAGFPVYITLLVYLFPSASPSILSTALLRSRTLALKGFTRIRPFSTALDNNNNMSQITILPRPSQERGNADHGWLKTFHTFSFAMYQDFNNEKYGSLRVINEDRVAPKTGFGTHSHKEFEIFSYVVEGELEHKDSMGNIEILKRGDVQLTSAGTGISHSEKAFGDKPVHFLQIWSLPSLSRLTPKYFTRHFSDIEKKDHWVRVVASVDAEGVQKDLREGSKQGEGPAPVQSPLTMYATLLSPGKSLSQAMKGPKGYIHVVMRSGYNEGPAQGASVKVAGQTLKEGDGGYLQIPSAGELTVENNGDRVAELVLFDLEE